MKQGFGDHLNGYGVIATQNLIIFCIKKKVKKFTKKSKCFTDYYLLHAIADDIKK